MVTPKWMRRRSTPIALENVLTYQQIMNIYGELVGKKPIVIPVPVLTPKLSSYWLYFVTSVPATTAMSLVEGLAHDYIGEDHEMRELVPQRLLSFRESVAVTLAAEKNHDLPARWVEGSIACREALFKVMQQFGRDGDFFSYRPLWWLRRAFDWLIGGPSFRTGRRDPDTLRMGDIVDGWRVIELCGYWHPAGFWGLLYWYAHLPLYGPLVHGAVAEIARRAELPEGPRPAA